MNVNRYVATNRDGIEHVAGTEVRWNLPSFDGTTWREAEPTQSSATLVLRSADALLDALDELIFNARPIPDKDSTSVGAIETPGAVLIRQTPWDLVTCAEFALDCAEHIASGLELSLPDGVSVQSVIADAREVLARNAADEEHRLGRLARLAAARRLRKRGEQVSDVARELLSDDIERDLDTLDDPAYAMTASVVDALLSSVETIRHLALPRYIAAREEAVDTHVDGEPSRLPSVITTPWGPIAFGAEHHPSYAPSWVAARDAAERAREAAADRGGKDEEIAERAWQASRLGALLEGTEN